MLSSLELETVLCPRCNKPFPKKRYDLGYRCCVNCSTEKRKSYIIEGIGEGSDVYIQGHIVSQEQAGSFERGNQILHQSVRKVRKLEPESTPVDEDLGIKTPDNQLKELFLESENEQDSNDTVVFEDEDILDVLMDQDDDENPEEEDEEDLCQELKRY